MKEKTCSTTVLHFIGMAAATTTPAATTTTTAVTTVTSSIAMQTNCAAPYITCVLNKMMIASLTMSNIQLHVMMIQVVNVVYENMLPIFLIYRGFCTSYSVADLKNNKNNNIVKRPY